MFINMELKMKIVHWNYFNESDEISGIKRYETELYNHMSGISDVQCQQVQRHNRNIFFDEFEEHDSDIVHATFQNLAPLALIKKPYRFVLTVHDLIPKFYYSIPQKIKHMWYLIEASINKADKIIVDSEYTKQDLISYLNITEDKIHVVPLGVSDAYHPHCKLNSCTRIGLTGDKKRILVNSSNKPWKNVKTLNRIIDRLPEYEFVKIGYGTTIQNENILNLGFVPEIEMPYLYSACDLFLHTSEYEGFGLPVLEAMSCGCPVVSSNGASLPEVVGNGGVLVSSNDVDMYCDVIDTLLSSKNTLKLWTKNGTEQASKFTWDRTAEQTLEVYKKCLNE